MSVGTIFIAFGIIALALVVGIYALASSPVTQRAFGNDLDGEADQREALGDAVKHGSGQDAQVPSSAASHQRSFLMPCGVIAMIAGVVGLIVAFSSDITVDTPAVYSPFGSSIGGGEVVNVSLIAGRAMILECSLALFLLGALLSCTAAVLNEIRGA